MHKHDSSDSLSEFNTSLVDTDNLLETSNDIEEIITSALIIANFLSYDVELEAYIDIHSKCSTYFANLQKKLSGKGRFTPKQLDDAFDVAIGCPFVLPRLYIMLFIACSSKSSNQLKLISDMLQAVSHPLRGFLLRFTAISIFPKQSELLVSFAVNNFKEMLFLLPGLFELFPTAKKTACEYLTSNINFSLFLSDTNPHLVESYFLSAQDVTDDYVSVAIVHSISQCIEGKEIAKYLGFFSNFLQSRGGEEMAKLLAVECCEKCDAPKEAYFFIETTPFADDCGLEITKLAIKKNDLETLSLCANRWKTHPILKEILTAVGTNTFASIMSYIPAGFEITKDFIQIIDDKTQPDSIRKVLFYELEKRSIELDDAITQMVESHDFSKEYFDVIFAEPYQFFCFKQLNKVVTFSLKKGVETNTILGFINRSLAINLINTTALRCHIYKNGDNGDGLVADLLRSTETSSINSRRILISHLARLEVSDESIMSLLETCTQENELISLCILTSLKKKVELTEKSLEKLLDLDRTMKKVTHQISLYFKTINLIVSIAENGLEISSDLVQTIFNQIIIVIQIASHKLFPMLTPEKSNYYLKILKATEKCEFFNAFRETIIKISELLPNC